MGTGSPCSADRVAQRTVRTADPTGGKRPGFTLIEVAIAQVIVAFSVVAMCQLLAAGTAANLAATEMTTAIRLTHPLHEWAMSLGTRELTQLDGKVFSPPVNAEGLPLVDQVGWEERIAIRSVEAQDNDRVPDSAQSMHIEILHNGHFVYGTSWLLMSPSDGRGGK